MMLAAQENRVRAELLRRANRHGRMHAELARLIARRRHHAAAVRVGAHDDGLPLERRILKLLHRNEEGVHVDVQNLAQASLPE